MHPTKRMSQSKRAASKQMWFHGFLNNCMFSQESLWQQVAVLMRKGVFILNEKFTDFKLTSYLGGKWIHFKWKLISDLRDPTLKIQGLYFECLTKESDCCTDIWVNIMAPTKRSAQGATINNNYFLNRLAVKLVCNHFDKIMNHVMIFFFFRVKCQALLWEFVALFW